VDPDLGPNALLADKELELTLRRNGADRWAVVVPLASEHAARYCPCWLMISEVLALSALDLRVHALPERFCALRARSGHAL
jgi:hypothetical protein